MTDAKTPVAPALGVRSVRPHSQRTLGGLLCCLGVVAALAAAVARPAAAHLTGGRFLARMWLPWLAALAVTGAVVAVAGRGHIRAVAGSEP